jgi:hypothetical protein
MTTTNNQIEMVGCIERARENVNGAPFSWAVSKH